VRLSYSNVSNGSFAPGPVVAQNGWKADIVRSATGCSPGADTCSKGAISDLYSTGSTSVQRSLVALILAPVISSLVIVSAVVLYFMLSIPASDPAPAVPQVIGSFSAVVFLGTIWEARQPSSV
jgi:hypothetical protein